MNEFFIKLVLTIVVICVSYFLYERYRIRSQLKWAYIVPGIPLIGNGLDFNSTIGKNLVSRLHTLNFLLNSFVDVCPTIQKYFNDAQSSTIVVSVFNKHFILSQDPKLVEFVLNSNEILDKTEDYRFLANWLGNGLLLTNGGLINFNRSDYYLIVYHRGQLETATKVIEPHVSFKNSRRVCGDF